MEIGATKAVQDRLKTTKIEESKGASLVFCWDTHLTIIKVRQYMKHRNKESALLYKLFYIVSVDCFSKVCG